MARSRFLVIQRAKPEESPGEAAPFDAFGVVLPKADEAEPRSEAFPCTGIPRVARNDVVAELIPRWWNPEHTIFCVAADLRVRPNEDQLRMAKFCHHTTRT